MTFCYNINHQLTIMLSSFGEINFNGIKGSSGGEAVDLFAENFSKVYTDRACNHQSHLYHLVKLIYQTTSQYLQHITSLIIRHQHRLNLDPLS